MGSLHAKGAVGAGLPMKAGQWPLEKGYWEAQTPVRDRPRVHMRHSDLTGVVPEDLPQLRATTSNYPFEVRVADTRRLRGMYHFPKQAAISACAISLIEQPADKPIPVNNCAGIMSAGRSEWWGWTARSREDRPTGYAFFKQGDPALHGRIGVFLAFAKPFCSLRWLAASCMSRPILTGRAYVEKWVGETPARADLERLYYQTCIRIVQAM